MSAVSIFTKMIHITGLRSATAMLNVWFHVGTKTSGFCLSQSEKDRGHALKKSKLIVGSKRE